MRYEYQVLRTRSDNILTMKKEIYIHITSAQGPDECERGVYLLVEEIKKEAFDKKTEAEIVYYLPGERIFTIQSAIIKITGEDADLFVKSFC
jgi:peptide chain release factor